MHEQIVYTKANKSTKEKWFAELWLRYNKTNKSRRNSCRQRYKVYTSGSSDRKMDAMQIIGCRSGETNRILGTFHFVCSKRNRYWPRNDLCSKWNGKTARSGNSQSEGNGCNWNFYRHFSTEHLRGFDKPWQMANNECVCPFSQLCFQTNQIEIIFFKCIHFV